MHPDHSALIRFWFNPYVKSPWARPLWCWLLWGLEQLVPQWPSPRRFTNLLNQNLIKALWSGCISSAYTEHISIYSITFRPWSSKHWINFLNKNFYIFFYIQWNATSKYFVQLTYTVYFELQTWMIASHQTTFMVLMAVMLL